MLHKCFTDFESFWRCTLTDKTVLCCPLRLKDKQPLLTSKTSYDTAVGRNLDAKETDCTSSAALVAMYSTHAPNILAHTSPDVSWDNASVIFVNTKQIM